MRGEGYIMFSPMYVPLSRCMSRANIVTSFSFKFHENPFSIRTQGKNFFPCVRILNGFSWNLKEVITTTNRWADYILGENVSGTRKHDTTVGPQAAADSWIRRRIFVRRKFAEKIRIFE